MTFSSNQPQDPIELPKQDSPTRDQSISISQQSFAYFLVAAVFAIAGFIVGAVTFSARGGAADDIRAAAAQGAREAVRAEMAELNTALESLKGSIAANPRAGTGGAAAAAPTLAPATNIEISNSPALGNPDAPITIVEFSDFQCPFCSRFHSQAYQQIKSQYGDKVRFVFKHFPLDSLHPAASFSANASECANEQGKFWEYHDQLFINQADLSRAAILRYAQAVNIADMDQFTACVDSGKYDTKVQADLLEGEGLGINGTPTFFINGQPIIGAQPFRVFQAQIDALLAAN
jgi:protein-disulfide isomerase